MAMIRKLVTMAAKIETTPGTAETLTGAEAAFDAINPKMTPNIGMTGIQMQGKFADIEQVPEGHQATCTFTTALRGDGAAGVPVWASTFLPACGWVNSAGTFSPLTQAPGSSVKTATIAMHEIHKPGGLIKQPTGYRQPQPVIREIVKPQRLRNVLAKPFRAILSEPERPAVASLAPVPVAIRTLHPYPI